MEQPVVGKCEEHRHGGRSQHWRAAQLKVTLLGNGTFSGSWLNAPRTPTTLFGGVTLQKTRRAAGYFLAVPTGSPVGSPKQGGAVTLTTP